MNFRDKMDKSKRRDEVRKAIEVISNPDNNCHDHLTVMVVVSTALYDLYQAAFEAGYRVRDGEGIIEGIQSK